MNEDDTTASTRDVVDERVEELKQVLDEGRAKRIALDERERINELKSDDVSGHTDDGRLPARPDDFDDVPPALRLKAAADGMSEFNRILKELAKSVWYITAILLGFFAVFVAYLVAKWGLTLV